MNRLIDKIYKLFLKIENIYQKTTVEKNHRLCDFDFFPEDDFTLLKELIDKLKNNENVEIVKLFSVYFHLKKEMTIQEFTNWILPFERYLHKSLKDDEFIVYNKDDENKKDSTPPLPITIILDHVRSSFNVGSIFRTSEAFHIEKIYLVGYTPGPDNFKTQKTTLGSHEYISWESVSDAIELIRKLKKEDYHTIAAETTSHAIPLETAFPPGKKVAVVFGNERFGLDPEVIAHCHETRQVLLQGVKNSLNIANCASLFIYEFYRQWNQWKT